MIHVTSTTHRYMYIGNDKENLFVIDIVNGPDCDQGGLYLWHFFSHDPSGIDLTNERTLRIIGVDLIED